MKYTLLMNIVGTQCTIILKLLAAMDEALLVKWNSFLVVDLLLDIQNGVFLVIHNTDAFASKCLDKNIICAEIQDSS